MYILPTNSLYTYFLELLIMKTKSYIHQSAIEETQKIVEEKNCREVEGDN